MLIGSLAAYFGGFSTPFFAIFFGSLIDAFNPDVPRKEVVDEATK